MTILENQIIKLRRRIEEFVRSTNPKNMIKTAMFLNKSFKAKIKLPKELLEKYMKSKNE